MCCNQIVASSDVTQVAVVGNVVAKFLKQSTGRTLRSSDTVGLIMDSFKTNDQN